MDDINAQAAQIRAALLARAAATKEFADAQAAKEREAIDTARKIRELGWQFCQYAQNAGLAHSISQSNIKGWIVGEFAYNLNNDGTATYYLVVTPSGELWRATPNRFRRPNSMFGREYVVDNNPPIAGLSLAEVQKHIASYVVQTGIPWPY
jgi:hypothetical protein